MANNIEDKLSNLRWLNKQLNLVKNHNLPVLKQEIYLKTLFINIFDLNAGKYENGTSKKLLIKDLENRV